MFAPLDLSLLRSFVAVIECASVLQAAARVGRSQSAVSMQMQRLEAEVGRPLFRREGRMLKPNPAGKELLLHARRLLRLSDEAMASLSRPEATGLVRLGVTCEPSMTLHERLGSGLLDLALVTRYPQQPFAVLRRERFVWAAKPETEVWLRDPLPVAVFEAGDIARRYALEALQDAERSYRVVCSSRSLHGLIAVAQAGLAVVGLVESSVPPDLIRLGPAEGMPPLPMFDLSLVSAPGEPSNIASKLRQALGRDLGKAD